MPRGNRIGPWGLGPMTGRGMGYCAGFPSPGFMSPGPGFGFGRGFGFRRSFSRRFSLRRGRGWRRAGFGGFGGYPYPPVMPYGNPFPPGYGYPYEMDYAPEYPAKSPTPGARQKK